MHNVQGSQEEVKPVELNVDTVYLRSNIHRTMNTEGLEVWEYDERQMNIVDYLREIVPENQEISDNAIAELSTLFIAYQEQTDNALAELSIALGGLANV